MKYIIALCLHLLPIFIIGQDWDILYKFSPEQTLQKIKFRNSQFGLTVGSLYNGSTKNIHRTTNGGQNWTDVSSGFTGMRFMDIFFVEDSLVYMSGNDGIILRSLDGGLNWNKLQTETKEQLWGLYFQSRKIGFAVGSNGTILKTTNGGTVWENIPTGINNLLYDVTFTYNGIGFASGSNILLRTDNGGDSWFPVQNFPYKAPADWIRSIQFTNNLDGFACADIGRIYRTSDGGEHWERLNSPTEEALLDLDFLDDNHGLVCGFNGTILFTEDRGQTWKAMTTPLANEHFYSVDYVGEQDAFVCTHYGKILKLHKAVQTNDWKLEEISLFPNPCMDEINISQLASSDFKPLFYELYNATGELIQRNTIRSTEDSSIPTNQLTPGNYFLYLSSMHSDRKQMIKIIKQ